MVKLFILYHQMWFYYHKIINFMYPFVFEQINLGELLTENLIINHKVNNTNTYIYFPNSLPRKDLIDTVVHIILA